MGKVYKRKRMILEYKTHFGFEKKTFKVVSIEEALAKMKRALDEFVIEGVKTTIPFHQQLLRNQDFIDGNYTTKFMETFVLKPEEKI